MKVDRQNWSE